MIAIAPRPTPSRLLLSAKLGLVSIPSTRDPSWLEIGEPGFERGQALDLLRELGQALGMTTLTGEGSGGEFLAGNASAAQSPSLFPDDAVQSCLEALDAVWIKGEDVVAAFVLEPVDGVYGGIRALADLLALHPKSKAALYVLSLPTLKAGLLSEIHRPLYRLLKKPLAEAVRILDWDRLKQEVEQLGERLRYLKPEFLEGISESVESPAPMPA